MESILKIGTRASPLALAQTSELIDRLKKHHPGLQTEVVKIITSGDRIQDRALIEAGGKGLFTKEIEEALLRGDIDCAVHSLKDMPAELPEGLEISCVLPREDVRDAFMSLKYKSLQEMPAGAVVGTASLRRQAFVLSMRPDLKVVVLRGNVGTRLKKLEAGDVDATLLAVAGLKRLGMLERAAAILETDVVLPAVAQGAIGIETRANDVKIKTLLQSVHCADTARAVRAERVFMQVMDGSCRTPMAAFLNGDKFSVMVAKPDGSDLRREVYTVKGDDVESQVRRAGEAFRAELPEGYILTA